MLIRSAAEGGYEDIWRILKPVFHVGETYCLPRHGLVNALVMYRKM